MPSKLESLQQEAAASAERRGHTLGEWTPGEYWRKCRQASCTECGKSVWVDPSPAPNGIDISGEAVALNCERRETKLSLEFCGYFWPFSGDLAYMKRGGLDARIYVDSVGKTWVDVRRIPEGGYFATEQVESYPAMNGASEAIKELGQRGFSELRWAFGNATERV